MVATYSDATKLKHAKAIAKENNCFIVERGDYDNKEYILYRKVEFAPNQRVGKRSSIDGILSFVKKACVTV